jgi:hypothetical protein
LENPAQVVRRPREIEHVAVTLNVMFVEMLAMGAPNCKLRNPVLPGQLGFCRHPENRVYRKGFSPVRSSFWKSCINWHSILFLKY